MTAEMRYYNGAPPDTMRFGSVFPGADIQLLDKTTEVVPGITLIALASDAPGTKELKEYRLPRYATDVGDRYLYAGLGTTLGVGAVQRVESNRSAALNEDDLRGYRMLLASSDDSKGSISEAARLAQRGSGGRDAIPADYFRSFATILISVMPLDGINRDT